MNYPAGVPMPGEVPPGVDAKGYIQQGLRAVKRPKLAECVWELSRLGSPQLALQKGDPVCAYCSVFVCAGGADDSAVMSKNLIPEIYNMANVLNI